MSSKWTLPSKNKQYWKWQEGRKPPTWNKNLDWKSSSCLHLWVLSCFSVTLWTEARQAPLSMGFSKQKYWSRLPCPPSRGASQPRDRTHISCVSCTAGVFFTTEPAGESLSCLTFDFKTNQIWKYLWKAISNMGKSKWFFLILHLFDLFITQKSFIF